MPHPLLLLSLTTTAATTNNTTTTIKITGTRAPASSVSLIDAERERETSRRVACRRSSSARRPLSLTKGAKTPPPQNNNNKTHKTTGCHQAEVNDDDGTPICTECKGPNFVYNEADNIWWVFSFLFLARRAKTTTKKKKKTFARR